MLKGFIIPPAPGKEPWKATFEWLIKEDNLAKIYNENYSKYDDRVYDINKGGNSNGGTQQPQQSLDPKESYKGKRREDMTPEEIDAAWHEEW